MNNDCKSKLREYKYFINKVNNHPTGGRAVCKVCGNKILPNFPMISIAIGSANRYSVHPECAKILSDAIINVLQLKEE